MKLVLAAILLAGVTTIKSQTPSSLENLKQINSELVEQKRDFNNSVLKSMKSDIKELKDAVASYEYLQKRIKNGRHSVLKKISKNDRRFNRSNSRKIERFEARLDELYAQLGTTKVQLENSIQNIKWEKAKLSKMANLASSKQAELQKLVSDIHAYKSRGERQLQNEKTTVEGYVAEAKRYEAKAKKHKRAAGRTIDPGKKRSQSKKAKKAAKKAQHFANLANNFKFSDKKIIAEINKRKSVIDQKNTQLQALALEVKKFSDELNVKVESLKSVEEEYKGHVSALENFISSQSDLISKIQAHHNERNELMIELKNEIKKSHERISTVKNKLDEKYGKDAVKLYSELSFYVNSSIAGSDERLVDYFEAKLGNSPVVEKIRLISTTAQERNNLLEALEGGQS